MMYIMKSGMPLLLCALWLYLAHGVTSEETAKSRRYLKLETKLTKMMEKFEELETQTQKLKDSEVQLSREVTRLREENTQLRTDIDVVSAKAVCGATYIRWGRTSCPNITSEMVYLGLAGGSYGHGGSNFLCLPRDPKFGNADSTDRHFASIVGTEYYLDENDNFPFETTSIPLRHQDVPCTMCKVTNGTSVIMIPAQRECYAGWNIQYRGYLMVSAGPEGGGEYICVDEYAEPGVDGTEDEMAVTLNPVEVECGSIPCLPYTQNYELACVVCSQ